jgi:hypothetical protein
METPSGLFSDLTLLALLLWDNATRDERSERAERAERAELEKWNVQAKTDAKKRVKPPMGTCVNGWSDLSEKPVPVANDMIHCFVCNETSRVFCKIARFCVPCEIKRKN